MESAEEVYQQHVKPLSLSERLRLLAMTAQDLAEQDTGAAERPQRSIMELHGLGAEIWHYIDAQRYVDELRL
jgi:hypothetical protein